MQTKRHHFETIDSTNNWAKQHAESFERTALTLVTADRQTSGRGRLDRSWVSPAKENLYATFCFFLESPRQDIGNIPQVMALSAAEVLEQLGFTPQLKWPNDLLLQGKKLGGILTETRSIDSLIFIAVGIGLNINMQQGELSAIDRPATSLSLESGKSYEIENVLQKLIKKFNADLEHFLAEGFAPFLSSYQNHLVHRLNSHMAFRSSQKLWEGTFEGINSAGALILEVEPGKLMTFVDGEPLT